MTVTDIRPAEPTATRESRNLAKLRVMLADPAQRENRDDIRKAIVYLTAKTALEA